MGASLHRVGNRCAHSTGWLLFVFFARSAGAEQTPSKELAKKYFDEGRGLEERGDFRGALSKYAEADKIAPTAGVRFHEAYCWELLNKLAQAQTAYEATLALAREQQKPEVEKVAVGRLESLRPRVPQLRIRIVGKKVAEVSLDGKLLGAKALEGAPIAVDPGEHELVASASNSHTVRREVSTPESQTVTVELRLETEQVPSLGKRPAGEHAALMTDPSAPPRSIALPMVVTLGAVAAGAGGLTAFVLAGSAQEDARSFCATSVQCSDDKGKIHTLDALALTGLVGATVLGGLAIVLWSRGGSKSAANSYYVVGQPSGLSMRGSF